MSNFNTDAINALRAEVFSARWDYGTSAMFFYDCFLTLKQEKDQIWGAKWRPGKFLYLLTRYLPVLDFVATIFRSQLSTLPACKVIEQVRGWTLGIGFAVAELALALRTWALWKQSRVISALIFVSYGIFIITAAIILGIYLTSLEYTLSPSPVYPGCLVVHQSPIAFADYLALLFLETIFFVLTSIKAIRHFAEARRHGLGSSTFLSIVYRDGTLWYFYAFVVAIVNIVSLFIVPNQYAGFLNITTRMLLSQLTTRLLLNIRKGAMHATSRTALDYSTFQAAPVRPGLSRDLGAGFDTEVGTRRPNSLQQFSNASRGNLAGLGIDAMSDHRGEESEVIEMDVLG